MTEKKVNTAIGVIYMVATLMVMVGALLKLQHHPNGFSILIFGFIIGSITSSIDNHRLKQKIKRLEEQNGSH